MVRHGMQFVVGPGSLHKSGRIYTPVDLSEPAVGTAWLVAMRSDYLAEKETRHKERQKGCRIAAGRVAAPAGHRVPEHLQGPFLVGERHHQLYRRLCHEHDGRFASRQQIVARALVANQELCEAPIGSPVDPHGHPEKDVVRIAEAVWELEECKKGAPPLSAVGQEFLKEVAAFIWGRAWKGNRGKCMRKMLVYCHSTILRYGGVETAEGVVFDTSERQAGEATRFTHATARGGLNTLCDLGLLRPLFKSERLDQPSVYLLPYSLVPEFFPAQDPDPDEPTPRAKVTQLSSTLSPLQKSPGLSVEEAIQTLYALEGEMRPTREQLAGSLGINRIRDYVERVEKPMVEHGLARGDYEGATELTEVWRERLVSWMEDLGVFEADEKQRAQHIQDREDFKRAEREVGERKIVAELRHQKRLERLEWQGPDEMADEDEQCRALLSLWDLEREQEAVAKLGGFEEALAGILEENPLWGRNPAWLAMFLWSQEGLDRQPSEEEVIASIVRLERMGRRS